MARTSTGTPGSDHTVHVPRRPENPGADPAGFSSGVVPAGNIAWRASIGETG